LITNVKSQNNVVILTVGKFIFDFEKEWHTWINHNY
jgi:hypothetical protein